MLDHTHWINLFLGSDPVGSSKCLYKQKGWLQNQKDTFRLFSSISQSSCRTSNVCSVIINTILTYLIPENTSSSFRLHLYSRVQRTDRVSSHGATTIIRDPTAEEPPRQLDAFLRFQREKQLEKIMKTQHECTRIKDI